MNYAATDVKKLREETGATLVVAASWTRRNSSGECRQALQSGVRALSRECRSKAQGNYGARDDRPDH